MSSNPSSLKFSLQKAASPLNLEEVDHYITEYGKRGLWRRLKAANQQPLTPVNFNSRNELLDFLLDVDSGPFSFDSACFVQLLAYAHCFRLKEQQIGKIFNRYLLSGAKGSFSNTDRTGKTVGGVASDSEGMSQFQVRAILSSAIDMYNNCDIILRAILSSAIDIHNNYNFILRATLSSAIDIYIIITILYCELYYQAQ